MATNQTHIIGVGVDASQGIRELARFEQAATRTVSAVNASVRAGLPSFLTPSLKGVAQEYGTKVAGSGLTGAEVAASARRVGTALGGGLALTGQGGIAQGHQMVQEALRKHRPDIEKIAEQDAKTYHGTYTREMARAEAKAKARRDNAYRLTQTDIGRQELLEDQRAQRDLRLGRRAANKQVYGERLDETTFFQRLYGRAHQTDPLTAPKLGQFFGGKALQTLGYGVTGGVLYGAISGAKELGGEAIELEKQFDLLKAQMTAVDQAGEFPAFKKGILDISSKTGQAASDVQQVALQLKGAFGNEKGPASNEEALKQSEALVKAARVTGLSVHEAIDNFTAVSRTYGVGIEEVSDLALGLQDRFGVLAKESIQFLGQIAPAAKEAGFSLKELAGVAATAQKYSGRSGQAIADSLGRVLPSLQENILPLKDIIKLDPKDVASGDLGNIFFSVIKQYDTLGEAQKKQVIELLGGKREAQTLGAIFSHVNEVLGVTEQKFDNAGRTQKAYTELQKSLSQQLAELRQKFTRFALTIYESGVDDFLKALVKAFELLAGAIGKLAGIPGMKQLIELLLLVKTLSLIKRLTIFDNLVSGIGGLAGRGGGIGAGLQGIAANAVGQRGLGLGILARHVEAEGATGRFVAGLSGAGEAATGLSGALGGLVAAIAPAVAAMLAFMAIQKYTELRGHEQDQDQSYGESLRGVSTAELRAARGGGSTRDKFRARLTGTRTDQEQRQDEIRRRDNEFLAAEIRAAQKKGYTKVINDLFDKGDVERRELGVNADDINDLAQKARDHPGQKKYYEALKKFVLELKKKLPKDIADAIFQQAGIEVDDLGNVTGLDPKADADKAAAEANKQSEGLAKTVTTAKEEYEAGRGSYADYVAALKKDLKFLADTRAAGGGKLPTDEMAKREADDLKQLADLAKAQYQAQIEIGEAFGSLNPKAKVDLLLQALKDPDIQGNADALASTAKDLTSAIKSYFDNQVKTAGSLEQALQIQRQGAKVPPELRAALIAELKRRGVENPDVPEYIKEDPEVVAQRESDLRKQVSDANSQLSQAQAHGDKLKQAQAQREKALADLTRAQHDNLGDNQSRQAAIAQAQAALIGADDAVNEALKSRADAYDNLQIALARYNPLQVATIKLQQAQRHLREASNQDEINAAQIEIVQAQQDLAEQTSELISAQANLAAAVAEAAGHTAESMRIKLADLQRQLAELADKGGYGTTAYKNIEAQIVSQKAGLDRQVRNDQKEYYEFLAATKQITKTQLIKYLEQLVQGVEANTSEWYQLQQEIYNLKHEMNGNLAFNLPNEFDLPTLYEVRRLGASANSGRAYTDNRQQVVNVYVTNGMSPSQVTQAVNGALTVGSGRYGVS